MIARIRRYGSHAEAAEEWTRLGIEGSVAAETEFDSSSFSFLEGKNDVGEEELRTIEDLGGRIIRCRSSRATRYLVVGDAGFLTGLPDGSDSLAVETLRRSFFNFRSTGNSPIVLRRGALKFERTLVMGVLNVTPDSFSDGGVFLKKEDAVRRAFEMADEGADIIDIGGESTRPFSDPVAEDEEEARVMPMLREIVPSLDIPVSIDTRRPSVARKAVEIGAQMVNDVSGLRNGEMIGAVRELGVPAILMHMLGEPRTMQLDIRYDDVIGDIMLFMAERMREASKGGIEESRIILDPGIGFGKELQHNLDIIRRLREFRCLGRPILVGPSRKAFIGKVLDLPKEERLEGTLAAVAASVINGASLVRVHDVKETVRVCRMIDAICRSKHS